MNRTAADWLAEADAHYDAQRWNDAGVAFECALALAQLPSTGQGHAWYRLGNVREEQGRDAAAEACFEKAVALDPVLAQAWNNLGGARHRLGNPDAAIEAYRRSMAVDPALAQPCLNLGRLYGGRGDHTRAAECFSAGLRHHPGDPTFQHLLAAARGETGSARAPQAYVAGLFDGLARQFEQHLVRDLEYHIPETLAKLARPTAAPGCSAPNSRTPAQKSSASTSRRVCSKSPPGEGSTRDWRRPI
jgi:predicted TPR repeat methyltransferase